MTFITLRVAQILICLNLAHDMNTATRPESKRNKRGFADEEEMTMLRHLLFPITYRGAMYSMRDILKSKPTEEHSCGAEPSN